MNDLRDQFPILKEYTYLNTARFSAQPNRIIEAQKTFLDHLQQHGSWNFEKWNASYESARQLAANLMSANANQIFFLANTSIGFNMAASYLPKLPVVCIQNDFPTVNIPWEPHGFKVRMLDHLAPTFLEELSQILEGAPKIISMSWIMASDGYELDLALVYRKCKEKGHILILDATQGFGAVPFAVDPEVACVVFASGFKWTLAGYGIAIGYISDHLRSTFEPFRGWNSLNASGELKNGAISLEVGTAGFTSAIAMSEGLRMIGEIGISQINKQNIKLKNYLQSKLEMHGRSFIKNESRSPIFNMEATDTEYDRLQSNKVQVTKQVGKIRISPNFYNNEADLDRFLSVLLEK